MDDRTLSKTLTEMSATTNFDELFTGSFAMLLIALIAAVIWVLYITYYNSRVIGYIITKLLKKFYVREGYLNVGSFTVCALSGKIMFRDIVYITHDYTLRIQDGWVVFRWWLSYVPKDVSEDLSHSDTRLSVMLNGLELHIYNRCELYSKLERTFGLDPCIIPWDELIQNNDLEAQIRETASIQQVSIGKSWRDLIPVIKADISSGRFVFGNRLVPTTLSINVEEAHCMYSTKPAASRLDHFMHFVKCKAENFKVILAPSPKYTGIADEPPRYMGAGFVVFSSNKIELYYYMDEPGVVPEEPEMLQLANGDIVESAPPIWGIDIKCGKGTDFSYGPWADRQREHLFKFFFPQNYQNLEVTKPPLPGEKRQVQSFDIRLSTLYESTIDILFTKNKETNAVHVNVGPGSYLEITMPWIVNKDGYFTKVTGQLLHLEATTSLQFRSLVESETLEFSVRCHYPIRWNAHQEWLLNLTGCKATGWFIYAHKDFFEDLINDWATKSKPDLLHFIPYTWKLTVLLKEFELLTQSNEYNWVDCSSQNQENAHIAVCGDLFDFSFDLPFDDFLPPTLPLRFWIQGESVDLAMYLPEVCTSRVVLLALDTNAKLLSRDGSILHPRPQDNGRKWRNICKRSSGWIDFWSIPIAALSINYIYHPMPPYGPPPQADITTPEKEEILLSPMRMSGGRKKPVLHLPKDGSQRFDPSTLTPDKVNLELEIGPSVMYLYGTFLRHLVHLKESVFGEDQAFTDMNDSSNLSNDDSRASNATAPVDGNSVHSEDEVSKKEFDPRLYRPLDVVVSITMHDIQAHLMKSCMEKDPPCPIILLERFGFEMKIEYKEMQLQLLLSPAILISTDKVTNRPHKDSHLNQGHMMLSGLQLRGHGMFSDRARTLEQKTLEYAWMLEVQIGKLSGKLTTPQLLHVVTGLETLILLMRDSENQLRPPRLPQECLHSKPPKQCPESDADGTYRCPSSNDVKYRMARCSIDAIDFYLVESGTAMNLWASPIRIATCNLHGNHIKSGITTLIPAIKLRHMIAANSQVCNQHGTGTASNSNTNTTCSGKSQHRLNASDGNEIWLEVGSVSLGPLILEAAVSLCNTDKNLHLVQHKFMKFHDEKYKKLWFLWPSDSKLLVTGRCGCIGGCVFFGRNRGGQRFFKPTRQDVQDGINIAAFRINENGKDPGFGQSILHENQLVFHTPPYNAIDMTIYDQPPPVWAEPRVCSSTNIRSKMTGSDTYIVPEHSVTTGTSSVTDSPSIMGSHPVSHTPLFDGKMSLPRRFSYTSINNRQQIAGHVFREVPYARLMDASPTSGYPPVKLDSDSRLNALSVPDTTDDGTPKSSISDSKLAVDYFNTKKGTLSEARYTEQSTPVGSSSITSLTTTEDKLLPLPKDEMVAVFKRTVSLSSENQSDTFFSAEEELSHNRNSLDSNVTENKSPTSYSSSLRNSVISSCGSYGHDGNIQSRKTFGSDFNIVHGSSKTASNANSNGGMKLNLSAHRSDHEIHTPEHRSGGYSAKSYFESASLPEDEKSLMGSLEQLQRQLIEAPASWPSRKSPKLKSISLDDDDTLVQTSASGLLLDSSDSRSVSSTSFISAVSSQEDLTLVNLHMQVNKPIVDSPLLISTYINHLSQVGCSNWNHVSLPPGSDIFTVPFFQRSNDGRLVFIGSRYLPRFDVLTEGFTSLKMVRRTGANESSPLPNFTRTSENTYPWDRNQPDSAGNTNNEDFEYACQEEFLSLRNESGTRTTIVIKMKGDVDIMVTPLILESLQRFVDALTPTLSVLHPVTVLNHLHMSCIGKVESANILKKDKYLSQLQGGGSKRSTVERVKNVSKNASGLLEPHSVYEEFIASQVQGTIVLPKINISVLQASIVEEVISFSALDNLRDLTCVSLMAICIDDMTACFHYGKQAREVVQTFHRPTVTPSGQKKGVLSRAAGKALLLGLHFTSAPGKDNVRGEPVYIETSEKQEQEAVITFKLGKVHVQLRRLRNECSLLKDAVITAIPSLSSKVLFTTCSKPTSSPANTGAADTSLIDGNSQFTYPTDEVATLSEEKMGFIMMECGFEGVSFKLVKRSKFEKEEQNPEEKNSSNEGNKTSSPAPANEGVDSGRTKEESDKHDGANETSGSGGPSAEPESGSQKEQQDKQASGSAAEKNEDSGPAGGPSALNKNVDGNASSCIIEIQQVWFNFAAPPRTPITRKIDYTRLDWNLLSTASPAINAWMNPSNRFAIRVVHMLRCQYRRNTAVITCLMAEALDMQSLHVPVKSRYGRITPMAKTLQEDPSCQLCNILKKYLSLYPNVEEYLKDDVPHLSTLRQGVIVLSRQWKNILYTPLLLDHNFKSKRTVVRPLNVTFAVPDPEEENAVLTDDGDGDGDGEGEADASCEECEVTDECAMLLNPTTTAITPNTLRKVLKTPSHKYAPTKQRMETAVPSTAADLADPLHSSSPVSPGSSGQQVNSTRPGVPPRKKAKALLPTQQLSSSRASVVFPIAPSASTYSPQHRFATTRQETSVLDKSNKKGEPTSLGVNPNYTQHSCGSVHSLNSGVVGDNVVQNSAGSLDDHNASPPMVSYLMSSTGSGATGLNKSGQAEDLYTWMAKQGFEDADTKMTESKVAKSTFWDLPKEETPVVNSSHDYTLLAAAGFSLYPMHDSLRLLDAHLIFEPLLSSLGVIPQQMITSARPGGSNAVTSLDSWGSNLTLVGGMESMRIDIVVSELGKGSFDAESDEPPVRISKLGSGKATRLSDKHSLEIGSEIPAFLCERVKLECDVERVADMTVVEDLSRQRRNMVYVSRGQLKKHTNTALNVSVSARYISQQVNMPLLRLLHQISNMYQNVKHTQSELKEQEPLDLKIPPPKPPPPTVDLTRTRLVSATQVDGKPPIHPHATATDPKNVLSPSSSIRSVRHQSFAQRLRSTSRSVKGYINLGDTPITRSRFSSLSDEKPTQIKEEPTLATNFIPKCWKTVYYLLDLYATMPETKTVAHRISTVGEVAEGYKSSKKYDPLVESKSSDDVVEKTEMTSSTPIPQHKGIIREEKTRLVIFAVARIHRTRLLATLSGLKLEAEITNLHSSLTCRKKIRPLSLEYSVTGQVGRTMIVLLEGVAPNQQTVVKVTVGKSQALYSSMSRRLKDKNSALLTVGAINIDIPQHPVALHGMMTRGTKQLSSTLQELRVTRTSSRLSRGATIDEMENVVGSQPSPRQPSRANRGNASTRSAPPAAPPPVVQINSSPLLQPLVMHFSAIIQSLSITASLLPSLQAKYQMDQLTSNGFTGSKAKFVVDLPRHSLSFSTKVEVTEANLPSEACIELPKVHVSAEYIQDNLKPKDNQAFATDGAVLRAGNYLSAVADIGEFEQSLTTDLLNHLMFVQKVFMKEVNEVVQKVYGGEKPVPIWLEDNEESNNNTAVKRILFSLIVRVKRIQLTATTPTNCAVRLETGSVEFQISNRFQNISGASSQPSEIGKIFVKTQLEVNLSLGQLIKNVLFEEADPEFQQFAFFKTRICIRNALQGEMVGEGEDKEVILITLRRPLIYIQPIAVDKAILVWLNYKNAYEYWNEQRSILNSEVLSATQQIYERITLERLTGSPSSGILFLQLTVEDMGICVPLNPLPPTSWGLNRSFLPENDSCAAVVITLESTSISACSAGSLVSKGRFIGLCLRFADDFETSLDDWKPDINNELAGVLMNFCSVSEGTYEVCSRTTTQKSESDNPKWFLNVQWQMEGVDIHLDVNIGKQLSALGHTLTMLTGVQEDEPLTACYDSDEADDNTNNSQESLDSSRRPSLEDTLSPLACDGSFDSKKRSKLLEKEMYEQVKIINDLKALGASQGTIEQEVKRLHELETLIFRGFRRDMIQKLRRQSTKGKYQLKDKFGIGTKGAYRSKSFILSSPTKEQLPKINGAEKVAVAAEPASDDSKLSTLPRVTFSESRSVRRQISLPSTSSDMSLSLDEREPMNWLPEQECKSEEASNAEDEINSTADSSTLLDDLSSRDQIKNGHANNPKQQEPNIDFELDVKVFINSGKCVLHTKDQAREDELKMMSRMKKDRSSSGGALEFPPSSPSVSRRSHKEKQANYTRLRLNPNPVTTAQISELTVFHIPGLDVKVHYESRIIPDGNLSPCYTVDSSGMIIRKTSAKKACLFAWITLQSIPEETIISPHILEFLEQTLEPIPTNLRNPLQFGSSEGNSNLLSNSDDEDDVFARYIMSGQYAYASFPVDVIVYFHMQPSTFRFSCLPVSRVECMLKLPSLDIVFSSKRADSFNDNESKSESLNNLPIAVGGLSVTGVMADFSLYIFHPYGGKKSGLKDPQIWSPLADAERKDSLSVNVEFVKFHLSRSRKLNFESPAGKNTEQSHATIRFSTIVDIGSASFKYDMRRLTEILAFPKAWYRRSIIRRLFLGDLTRAPVFSDGEDESGPDHSEEHDHESGMEDESKTHARSGNEKLKSSAGREKLKRQESKKPLPRGKRKRGSVSDECIKPHKLAGNTAWQTLVLFTVNFKRLNVHMNMGNVMGNVTWLTKDFHSEGRLSIGSTGHKNLFIGLGFGGSSLDAKGGIVGGTIELSKIDTFISIHEDPGTEPDHTIGLKLFALELRLDYMGTAILMSRVSSLNISLRDEWKVTTRKSSGHILDSTKRPGMVFMHGDLNWDQLQIMISKSTAADLIKMYYKLDEFFSQQFKSSKRLFTSLQQDSAKSKNVTNISISSNSFRKRNLAAKKRVSSTLSDTLRSPGSTAPETAEHHRHWQPCLLQVANLHLSTMKHALPAWGTILGGTMDLHGSNISLACFHGINFKSKSWALFSLKEPCITFATEAQEVNIDEVAVRSGSSNVTPKDVHIVQTLIFSLGISLNMQSYAQQHHSMATICRVSRNVLFPPQFRTIQEWFHYAFSCSDIDAVDRFPSLERERLENVEGVRCRTPKPQEQLNHTREVIFALPSMRLDLKTDHLQSVALNYVSDEKALVDCSFITEFEDHIFVTVDAEAFFFLHDLITSYMKEKDRVAASQGYHRAYSPSPPETSKKRAGQSADSGKDKPDASFEDAREHHSKDWRNFQCKTWHLEPTVRLLSWGGKSIEPYGVDYILQKLGFSHARTTIPKWMQRGFMDPLDKVLAVLVSRIIVLAKEEPKHDSKKLGH